MNFVNKKMYIVLTRIGHEACPLLIEHLQLPALQTCFLLATKPDTKFDDVMASTLDWHTV